MSGDSGISAFPEGENLFSWIATITGANGTVSIQHLVTYRNHAYEALTYKLSIKFPSSYPYVAPTVRFETPCFHPNVDQFGNICLDILKVNISFGILSNFIKDKWSAIYNVRTILLSVQSLLGEPNNDSPLNGYAAALWDNQQGI